MGQRIPVTLGNIAPLALKPFHPGKLALVCEGGGQRGIFTAGVLDEFLDANFDPFDFYFGTSAGAQNLSAFVCRQPGYARRVITRYTTRSEFFNPLRFVRGGNLIDLDWLVDATSRKMPLAMDNASRLFDAGREFYMCACRSDDDYTPEYFAPDSSNWLDIIRASSAIPGFYRTGVQLGDFSYQDGGISDAIPVRQAAQRGAQTLVVIRTVPSQMYYTPQWFRRMERWLGEGSLKPLINLVQHHETSYAAIQRFIDKPPGDLRIFEIYPPAPLKSIALGSRQVALRSDYKLGRQCGRYFLATVGRMLARKPPLRRFSAPAITAPAITAPVAQPDTVPLITSAANDIVMPQATPEANDAAFNGEDLA